MRNLGKTGLSMSDAQTASNMANQIAVTIENKLDRINNFSKTITYDGKEKILIQGTKMPEDIKAILNKKAQCHALQAFLMEGLKTKVALMKAEKEKQFVFDCDIPVKPLVIVYCTLPTVKEDFGWAQLTDAEYNEFLEKEAIAAHIGKFIHSKSKLDQLRNEFHKIPSIDWMEIEKDKKIPIDFTIHHTSEGLDILHGEFAVMHMEAEKRVNYYKAKVMNLVSAENTRIERDNAQHLEDARKDNAVMLNEYQKLYDNYQQLYNVAYKEFQANKESKLNELSALKIVVSPLFKVLLDELLPNKKK